MIKFCLTILLTVVLITAAATTENSSLHTALLQLLVYAVGVFSGLMVALLILSEKAPTKRRPY